MMLLIVKLFKWHYGVTSTVRGQQSIDHNIVLQIWHLCSIISGIIELVPATGLELSLTSSNQVRILGYVLLPKCQSREPVNAVVIFLVRYAFFSFFLFLLFFFPGGEGGRMVAARGMRVGLEAAGGCYMLHRGVLSLKLGSNLPACSVKVEYI